MFGSLFGNKSIQNLDSEAFERRISSDQNAVIIDVRTHNEYRQVRIPNSILIDIYQKSFLQEIEKLDKSKNYYVYCHSGARSFQASAQMVKLGFENVSNLAGGIVSWYGEVEQD